MLTPHPERGTSWSLPPLLRWSVVLAAAVHRRRSSHSNVLCSLHVVDARRHLLLQRLRPPLLLFHLLSPPATPFALTFQCHPPPPSAACLLGFPFPERISMAHGGKRGMSWQENSISSQESGNHRDEHVHSDGYMNPDCFRRHEPLSGCPYFTCILFKTNIRNHLAIPAHFYHHLPAATVPVVLSCGNKTWGMSYSGDRSLKKFDSGWRKFAADNHLKIGDGCIFELVDRAKLTFKVQILDGKIPVAGSSKGDSSDAPILLD